VRILHTSDWHLGKNLYCKKRYEEFESFLAWLTEAIQQNEIEVLLVAGDIFDTINPTNRAQELYYRFLRRVARSSCRHVVIVAGNHDSPTFLNAPKELLRVLDVHVVGSTSDAWEDEVLVLYNGENVPELIVCAVPYLRDKDIREAEAGESIEDKERNLVNGIRNHYAGVGDIAVQKRNELGVDIPIIGMGHLFTKGGQIHDGDGVRDLYVGSLAHVTAAIFPACFSYVALGHLHVPQKVNGNERIRYSGSPLPMGFGEAEQQKSVCLVELHSTEASVQLINVPVFQKLERVKGDLEQISNRIVELSAAGSQTWLEIIYGGDAVISDLRDRLEALVSGTQLEILQLKNNRIVDRVLRQSHDGETLELNVIDVFTRCAALHEVPEHQMPELLQTYQEALKLIQEADLRAE
jgi:exonuclease SbcD